MSRYQFRGLIVVGIATLVIALGVAMAKLADNSPDENTRTSLGAATSLSSEEQQKLESDYQRTKNRIDESVEAGRLTKEQAELLRQKIDEVRDYLKTDDSSAEWQDQTQAKHKEWQAWAKEHNISYGHIVNLY